MLAVLVILPGNDVGFLMYQCLSWVMVGSSQRTVVLEVNVYTS